MTVFDDYHCYMSGIQVLDPTVPVIVSGNHVDGKTNEDVEVVRIDDSNTPFIIPEIFSTFPNLLSFGVFYSNLQSIKFPSGRYQLDYILLYGNNITRIENATFVDHPDLYYLAVVNSKVEIIEEDAFVGLENLEYLVLIDNLIEELKPKTFSSLIGVTYIDLDENNLVRIDEELFATNRKLYALWLVSNKINEISPNFVQNLRNNLGFINLSSNVCISQRFFLETDDGWASMNDNLQSCFENYNSTKNETRRITLEFTGSLIVYDEFDNIIAKF